MKKTTALAISRPYRTALFCALALHLCLFFFLFAHWARHHYGNAQVSQPEIIHAVAVDQQQVEKQIADIKAAERHKREQHLADLRRLHAEHQRYLRKIAAEKHRWALERKKQKIARQQHIAKLKKKRIEKAHHEHLAAELKKKRLAKAEHEKLIAKLKQQQKQALAKMMQQQLAQEQKALDAAAQARKVRGEIDKYKSMVVTAIERNWLVPDKASKGLNCQLEVQVAPGGTVLSVKLLRSSGSAVLDRSAQAAVYKASPLPVPKSPQLFDNFRVLRLTVRPEGNLS